MNPWILYPHFFEYIMINCMLQIVFSGQRHSVFFFKLHRMNRVQKLLFFASSLHGSLFFCCKFSSFWMDNWHNKFIKFYPGKMDWEKPLNVNVIGFIALNFAIDANITFYLLALDYLWTIESQVHLFQLRILDVAKCKTKKKQTESGLNMVG